MSSNRYLDYNNTCPTIGRGISDMEDKLDEMIYDLVQELSPKFSETDASRQFITDTVKYFSQQLEPTFELVRESNEGLRTAADQQISELVDEIEDLERQIG